MKHPQPALAFLRERLHDLEAAGLRRARPALPADPSRIFCSNDYLGLAGLPAGVDLPPSVAPGASGSRLISGDHGEIQALEGVVARWLRTESALVFTSGYAANVGLVSALAGRGDLVLSDAHNHASLIDGARLSRADVVVYPHLDVTSVADALARAPGRRVWVLTESYFSMDADSPNLAELRRVCDAAGAALVVDEAHALGVLGPDGRGVCAAQGVVPDAVVGTLGKAFGAAGAFVAGSALLIEWLWNRARSFVFSTGVSPLVARIARERVELAAQDPSLRERALARAESLRRGMRDLGIEPLGYGPIVPWVLGEARAAVAVAEALREEGIYVQAIRPPTVAEGASRLRWTASARHTPEDVARALAALARAWKPRARSSS